MYLKALDLTEEHIVHNEKCKQALENNDYHLLCNSLSNRLEPVSMAMHPDIKRLKITCYNVVLMVL